MTTFMLEKVDWTTRPIKTSVSVCHHMASHPTMLSDNEMDCVTSAFRSLETGLRAGTIDQEDIQAAMLMVGLNPSDQDCVDIPNELARSRDYPTPFIGLNLDYFVFILDRMYTRNHSILAN